MYVSNQCSTKLIVKSDIRHHRQQKATFEIGYELRITLNKVEKKIQFSNHQSI